MLKILQARLQQYVNRELPDVQAGFRKAEEPEIKLPTSTGSSAFDCVDHNKLWTIVKMGIVKMENGNTRTPDLPLEKSVCRSGSNS